jgi:hypothetical protein
LPTNHMLAVRRCKGFRRRSLVSQLAINPNAFGATELYSR